MPPEKPAAKGPLDVSSFWLSVSAQSKVEWLVASDGWAPAAAGVELRRARCRG